MIQAKGKLCFVCETVINTTRIYDTVIMTISHHNKIRIIYLNYAGSVGVK